MVRSYVGRSEGSVLRYSYGPIPAQSDFQYVCLKTAKKCQAEIEKLGGSFVMWLSAQ